MERSGHPVTGPPSLPHGPTLVAVAKPRYTWLCPPLVACPSQHDPGHCDRLDTLTRGVVTVNSHLPWLCGPAVLAAGAKRTSRREVLLLLLLPPCIECHPPPATAGQGVPAGHQGAGCSQSPRPPELG
ncbi:hypothetical protein BTVI_128243 [Pitangus sulphuratus]|nr:hypothetical protein BTVI_128243 [Pitangus sulphuratus]